MSPSLATLICAVGVAGLFYLDRDKNLHTSKALWIPEIWILISGSRPVSMWLGMSPATVSSKQLLEGNPVDRLVFALLIATGLVVVLRRGNKVISALRSGWPIVLFFSYCLLSVLWSDFPGVAFRRWIKAVGDLVMVFIIVTESHPVDALQRLFTRIGFILLPASVLLSRYYPGMGRKYDTWSGELSNTGVTTNKNMLGVLTFVLSLGATWLVLRLLWDKDKPNRFRHMVAQGTLLAFGIWVVFMAHSATSGACCALGVGFMVAISSGVFRRRPRAVHALVVAILIVGSLTFFLGGVSGIAHALGRKSDLTGRTEIWQILIPMAPNPILGAGYESFWLGPRLETIWNLYSGSVHLNEAHNGYLEIYLNLGWAGVGLLVFLLIFGYRRAASKYRSDPSFGGLMLAYVLTASIYSITEAGFRAMDLIWVFLLLAILASSCASEVQTKNENSEADKLPTPQSKRPQALLSTASNHG